MVAQVVAVLTAISLAAGAVVALAAARVGANPILAGGLVFLAFEGTLLHGVFERRSPVFGRILWRLRRDVSHICLTLDDGPNEPFTSQVLDVLGKHGVTATFFVIGMNAERHPEVLRRAAREGHEIGNHTYDHGILALKSPPRIREQIRKTSGVVEAITGARPRVFRAPHGFRNLWVDRIAREEGCVPVAWTLGVWDTDDPGTDAIVERTLRRLSNGCILLLHDGRGILEDAETSQLVQALPLIIERARKAGYNWVSLSQAARDAKAP